MPRHALAARFQDDDALELFTTLLAPNGNYNGAQVVRVMGEALRLSHGEPVRADEVQRAYQMTLAPRQVNRGLCA